MSDPPTGRGGEQRRPVPPRGDDAERTEPMPVPPPESLDLTEPLADVGPHESSAAPPVGLRRHLVMDAAAWWGVVAVVAMVLAASFEEDGDNGWGRFGLWAAFSVVAAAATLVPTFRGQLQIGREQAWRIAAVGAGGLLLHWVLFVAPSIERNVSFLATVGVAAGVYAAWRAPGRPGTPGARPF